VCVCARVVFGEGVLSPVQCFIQQTVEQTQTVFVFITSYGLV